MKQLKLILIFALFLLVLPLFSTKVNADIVLYNATPFTNLSDWGVPAGRTPCHLSDNTIACGNAEVSTFLPMITNASDVKGTNVTIIMNITVASASNYEFVVFKTENGTGLTTAAQHTVLRANGAGGAIQTMPIGDDTTNRYNLIDGATTMPWTMLRWEYLSNTSFCVSVNGTLRHCSTNIQSAPWGNLTWYGVGERNDNHNFSISSFIVMTNGTQVSVPLPTPINNTVPIINISYPSNYTTISNSTLYPLLINGTVTIQNGTVANITINSTFWKNIGNNTNFNFTFNGTFTQGVYVLNLSANSTDGNRTSAIVIFTIDITKPSFTSNIQNNITLFYAYANITFQINLTDNLRVYSMNVSTSEGFVFNITGLNTTNYIYNGSINVSNYGIGLHTLTTEGCDPHTSEMIDDWQYSKKQASKEIKFNFGKRYFAVLPVDSSLISSFDTIKLNDRYIFEYSKNPLNKQNIQSFLITSSEFIDIIGNEKGYNGWLVIPKLNKWIDFNIRNEKAEYVITRIDANNVIVTISNIKNDDFTFESAGDLNCERKDYKYYIFNYTATFSSTAIETTKEIFKLQIDFKDISLNGNGTFNYDSIIYNTTNVSLPSQINLTINLTIPSVPNNETNVTFFWNFVLNTSSLQTINFTQLVQRIRLSTCGVNDIRTLNISIFNEQLPSQYLEASIDAVFTTWTNNSGNTLNFTFNFDDNTNYSICIFPNTTINADAYLKYNTTNGFLMRWYISRARLTTNTSLLYLFNFDTTTGISELRGTIRDPSFDFYQNIVTHLQRYYVSEDLWRTIQIDKSDKFGLILLRVIEATQDYRLIFMDDGSQIDSTNKIKFTCTSSICNVNFQLNPVKASSSQNLIFHSGYNNITQVYELNFTDSSGLTSSVRLRVSQLIGVNTNDICDTTLSATSGTLTCNTTGYTGTLIVRIYSSASLEIAQILEYITKNVNKIFQKAGLKNEGALWSLGISTTLAIGGFATGSAVIGVILYVVSLIFIFFFGILNWMTTTFITLMAAGAVLVIFLLRRQ